MQIGGIYCIHAFAHSSNMQKQIRNLQIEFGTYLLLNYPPQYLPLCDRCSDDQKIAEGKMAVFCVDVRRNGDSSLAEWTDLDFMAESAIFAYQSFRACRAMTSRQPSVSTNDKTKF